jgi:hypothetical protein
MKFAYDRPSNKLKGFLAKHYSLRNFVRQNNNFVVFDDYFGNINSCIVPKPFEPVPQLQMSFSKFTPHNRMDRSIFTNNGDKSIFSSAGKDLLSTQKLELSPNQKLSYAMTMGQTTNTAFDTSNNFNEPRSPGNAGYEFAF